MGDVEGRFILSEEVPTLITMSDIIDTDRREWDYEIIEEHFVESDAQCIMAIPLRENGKDDEKTWAFSQIGDYTVKSAYILGKGCDIYLFSPSMDRNLESRCHPEGEAFLLEIMYYHFACA